MRNVSLRSDSVSVLVSFPMYLSTLTLLLHQTPRLMNRRLGAVMFFCGLPAIKTIDTLGRRKWLISTLPLMCIFMAAAAYSFPIPYSLEKADSNTVRLVATLLYRKTTPHGVPEVVS